MLDARRRDALWTRDQAALGGRSDRRATCRWSIQPHRHRCHRRLRRVRPGRAVRAARRRSCCSSSAAERPGPVASTGPDDAVAARAADLGLEPRGGLPASASYAPVRVAAEARLRAKCESARPGRASVDAPMRRLSRPAARAARGRSARYHRLTQDDDLRAYPTGAAPAMPHRSRLETALPASATSLSLRRRLQRAGRRGRESRGYSPGLELVAQTVACPSGRHPANRVHRVVAGRVRRISTDLVAGVGGRRWASGSRSAAARTVTLARHGDEVAGSRCVRPTGAVPPASSVSAPGGRRRRARALTSPIRRVPKWKTVAASTASAPASTAGAKCSTAPAPPEAITGMVTSPAYGADQLEVEAVLGAVGVHRVEQDLPRAELGAAGAHATASSPADVRPPWVVTSKPESVPAARRASTDSTSTWLPNRSAISATSSGRADRGRVDGDLVGAGAQQPVDVLDRAHSPADGQRDEDLLGSLRHDLHRGRAALVRGGDVEEGELVGALGVVGPGQLDRVAGVAQLRKLMPLTTRPASTSRQGMTRTARLMRCPSTQWPVGSGPARPRG